MKKTQFAWSTILPAAALTAALCFAGQPAFAQSSDTMQNPSTQQQQPTTPTDAQNTASQKTFSGKIMKSGSKLILSSAGTTYQLDDQQKAQDFVNKNVKVTGVLDSATGTIRVSAIDPS
jgi:hypothetical protein